MPKGDVGFVEVLTQLKITNRLLAAQLRSTLSQQDMVRLLASTGASNLEIASVLDTTAATVATTIQRLKKKDAARTTRETSVSDAVPISGDAGA